MYLKSVQKIVAYFTVIALVFSCCNCDNGLLPKSFYIRHFFGKCLEYDASLKAFVFAVHCREKFVWKGGARLIHTATNKCLVPQSSADGSILTLSHQCNGTNTLFMYKASAQLITHLITGKCLHPQTGGYDPPKGTALIVKTGCSKKKNKFFFKHQAHFIIRHFSSLCWMHDKTDNFFKLQNSMACDRFEYINSYNLRHFKTGKCVVPSGGVLSLTSDCSSSNTIFQLNPYANMKQASSACIHPEGGSISPSAGTRLLSVPGCADEDRLRMYLYDDRDVLHVKITSESCKDIPAGNSCGTTKGFVEVNGYQYSLNTRGINSVIFDYRSGLFEHRSTYDIFASSTPRNSMTTFLNTLEEDKILFMSVKDAVLMQSNLALALQKFGVSATFATPSIPTKYSSLAAVFFTGKVRKSWEKSVNKIEGQGSSIIETKINIFRDFKGTGDCSEELGIRIGKLPDTRFYARTTYANDLYHRPFAARLHSTKGQWCSTSVPVSDYLQVDLGVPKIISGIAIQANAYHGQHYITKFKLQYSIDGMTWHIKKDSSGSNQVFVGLKKAEKHETRANWFERTLMRMVRIVPKTRVTPHGFTCLRFELYGCSPEKPIFENNVFESSSQLIAQYNNGKASIYSIAPLSKKVKIGISTAADNVSLARYTDQLHLYRVNDSVTFENGTVLKKFANVTKVRNIVKKQYHMGFTEFQVPQTDYHVFEVGVGSRIMDTGRTTGNTWNTISYEAEEQISISSIPIQIKRRPKDRSILKLNISKSDKELFANGDVLNFNLSLSQWVGVNDRTYSNAYEVDVFVYYDSQFLTLQSTRYIARDEFSLEPTFNATKQGMVHIRTDTFWLLNNQEILFELKFNNPTQILKGDQCNGHVIVDFKYKTNLKDFNGTVNYTSEERVPYKCKIDARAITMPTSIRLTVPEFSMLFDDVNGDFIFCKKRSMVPVRSSASCYLQRNDSVSWIGLPGIAAIVGTDTTKKTLFGIDYKGAAYWKSHNGFSSFMQVEDTEWTSIESQQQIRKAKSANLMTSLPQSVSAPWVLSTGGKSVWAATKDGIMKYTANAWKRVVWLQ